MNAEIDITGVHLKTRRLTLRPWQQTDLEDFYQYAMVEGVGEMAGWSHHRDKGETQMILDGFIREKKVLALEYEGKVIGSLGIEKYDEKSFSDLAQGKGREIGYVLSREYWGRGLMPEAVAAVKEYLFWQVGLDFITVSHFKWNDQSRRVIEKSGFQYVKDGTFDTRYGTREETREYILYRQG